MNQMKSANPAPRFEAFKPSSDRASMTAKRIRREDTAAELSLRKALWARGLRYRTHYAGLPGRPDVVFVAARVAIFVDGDFWHGRDWTQRERKLREGANAPYWLAKIAANIARDHRKNELLQARGWRILRFWETDLLRERETAVRAIEAAVSTHL